VNSLGQKTGNRIGYSHIAKNILVAITRCSREGKSPAALAGVKHGEVAGRVSTKQSERDRFAVWCPQIEIDKIATNGGSKGGELSGDSHSSKTRHVEGEVVQGCPAEVGLHPNVR
jgi:hypothetical protein